MASLKDELVFSTHFGDYAFGLPTCKHLESFGSNCVFIVETRLNVLTGMRQMRSQGVNGYNIKCAVASENMNGSFAALVLDVDLSH